MTPHKWFDCESCQMPLPIQRYAPKINVIEVNNQSMGHRYIGRFSVPGKEGKPERYTVSLSRAEEYPSKDDPQLAELARKKALEFLMRKHPDLFLELGSKL